MAGKIKIIAMLVCVMFAGLLAASCAPSIDTKNFKGEWEFLYGSQEGLSEEDVEMSKSLGGNAVMILNEDGTGSLDLFGDATNLTWVATNETEGSVTVEGSNAASMKVEDDSLTLSGSDDSTLTFGRLSNE